MTIVFLSSTFVDLRAHRAKVIEGIDRLAHIGFDVTWRAMEAFPASFKDRSLDVALDKLRESDIFVGALGPRYGSFPPEETRSFTEIEYDTAVAMQLPRGLFLMDELAPEWEKLGTDADPSKRMKLAALRERFQADNNVNFFDTPGDLAMKVVVALIPVLQSEKQRALAAPASALVPDTGSQQASAIALVAAPAAICDDGSETATISATLLTYDGDPVDDEPVLWIVSGPGTANPIHTRTINGVATTVFTPQSQAQGLAYVVCIALRSGISQSIRVDLIRGAR